MFDLFVNDCRATGIRLLITLMTWACAKSCCEVFTPMALKNHQLFRPELYYHASKVS